MYVLYKFNVNLNKAASVGIIGRADGPISIFIAGAPSTNAITIVFGLLALVGIIYLISKKKLQKKF
jgi:Na+-transporting methylmalonyl-CoA/oxaloacetate decarboxylase beta subunit